MHEARNGPAAEPDHQQIARIRHEQQETHHRPGIGELQFIGCRKPNGALNSGAAQMQRAHTALFAHFHTRGQSEHAFGAAHAHTGICEVERRTADTEAATEEGA